MPAKYLKGSIPLKTGFIESRKASEKYVICIIVIISKAITLADRKMREVNTPKRAKPTTK